MTEEAPPLTGEYLVDDRFPVRAAAVLAGETLRTPWPWIAVATAALVAGLALTGPDFLWILAAVLFLSGVLLPIVTYVLVRRAGSRQYPPGSVLRIGFGDEHVSMQAPLESSTMAYSMFSEAKRRGDIVLLRLRANKAWAAMPGQLFTDADLARFSHK